ncbi:unnamed protein product [Brachionus calyciflorus]|uniref:Uncharacterized protein n=1 Tax=Brachionus calyciflorus TaxID=104777 RepID=A0A813S717_9BILA|nr:unnamed protein product [Brachionus calyciflorus]
MKDLKIGEDSLMSNQTIIAFKIFYEDVLKNNQSICNVEFRFFTPDTILAFCVKNAIFLFEHFLQSKTIKAYLENQDSCLKPIEDFVVYNACCLNKDIQSNDEIKHFNKIFTNEFLPIIFDFEWYTNIEVILYFSLNKDEELTDFLKFRGGVGAPKKSSSSGGLNRSDWPCLNQINQATYRPQPNSSDEKEVQTTYSYQPQTSLFQNSQTNSNTTVSVG